jgi:hypothetical protein
VKNLVVGVVVGLAFAIVECYIVLGGSRKEKLMG